METKSEDRLSKSREEDLVRIFDESRNEIYIFDQKTLLFVEVNRAARENLDYTADELSKKTPLDLKPDFSEQYFKDLLIPLNEEYEKKIIFETYHRRKDGSLYPVEVHLQLSKYRGKPAYIAIILDITERKKSEEERKNFENQLRHSQKLESLGTLAGGIAHDFNNILTGILGYSDLAKAELEESSKAYTYIDEVIKASRAAADLIQQMLAYAGKGSVKIGPINLSSVIEDMRRLMEISISKKCVLKYEFMPELPNICADNSQIRQIILNLVINASEAIGDRSGIISITTGVMYCEPSYFQETYLNVDLKEGLYSYIEISDNGKGIPKEDVSKIFDPFYSTKFSGHGLGLAAVLGIVHRHNGAIKVYTEENKGSTFKVLFPVAKENECVISPNDTFEDWQSSGTILVVDDEESIRGLAQIMLESVGFTICTAVDGRDAVEKFREMKNDIDLVLVDMTMPHLSGLEVFREIKLMSPDMKIVLFSGYNEQSATSQFNGKGLSGFIQKPFTYDTLVGVIKNALEDT